MFQATNGDLNQLLQLGEEFGFRKSSLSRFLGVRFRKSFGDGSGYDVETT